MDACTGRIIVFSYIRSRDSTKLHNVLRPLEEVLARDMCVKVNMQSYVQYYSDFSQQD